MLKKKCSLFVLCAASAGLAIPSAAHAEGFDGVYAGVEGGIGILEADGSTLLGPFESSDQSAYVGGVLGARTHVGGEAGLVVGLEGNGGIYTSSGDGRYGVSGIAGFEVGEGSLLYTRVGYGWLDGVATPEGTGIGGIVLGAGFETQVSGNANIRLDYRYLGYEDFDIPDATSNFSGHEITAGVIFDF